MGLLVIEPETIPDLTPKQVWTMPRHQVHAGLLILKGGVNSYSPSNESVFHTSMNLSNVEREGTYVEFGTANVKDNTLIEVEGSSGIITHIITPNVNANGQAITIHVTADDVTTDYHFQYMRDEFRAILGGARAGVIGADTTGYQAAAEFGSYGITTDITSYNPLESGNWDNNPNSLLLLTPKQTLDAGIGIPFKEYMRVGISNGGVSSVTREKWGWVTYVKDHGGPNV